MNLDLTKLSCVCVGAILELTTSTGFANPLPSADVDFPEINPPQIALGQLLFFFQSSQATNRSHVRLS